MTRLLLAAMTMVGLAIGQANQASIIGIVSDPHARLVQNAPISAVNVETGQTYGVESNDKGQYRLTGLPEGTYEVSLTIRGFEEIHIKDVKAGAAKPGRVDIVLRPR